MPFGDRTGPEGIGPMTGRGAGYCSGTNQPGRWSARPFGGGFGYGRRPRGRARGFRNTGGFYPMYPQYVAPQAVNISTEEELVNLRDLAESISDQLSAIRERIDALTSSKKQEE